MNKPTNKYRRYRTANSSSFNRLETPVENIECEVNPSSLENITYNNAKAELKFLSEQIEIIEELYKRKALLSKRAKELQKFINVLDKLESTEEEVISELLDQVKVAYNEEKKTLTSQERLNDFL